MARLRVAMAQLNLTVGALDDNVAALREAIGSAAGSSCDVVVFPELAVTGYPPEDLLLRPTFVADGLAALDEVASATAGGGPAAVVGFVDRRGDALFNAAAVCANGAVVGVQHKRLLPNYAVFDEMRYFQRGAEPLRLHTVAGVPVGVTVCEDLWSSEGPAAALGAAGAEVIVNLNGSPYETDKVARREATLAARTAEAGCPIVYVNLVGGQDELVFDGGSMVVDVDGSVLVRARSFVEDLVVVDLEVDGRSVAPPVTERAGGSMDLERVVGPPIVVSDTSAAAGMTPLPPPLVPLADRTSQVWQALVVATRDYVRKNGFSEVVLGLSGGIDSSLVAAVAADALGPTVVHGVLMPSRYSSDHSVDDAVTLSDRLGIDRRTIAIEPAHRVLCELLAPSFDGLDEDLTEENLQSRIRGVLLMALSNKFGWLVLTTSNKSESAVGYSTLYGDSAGGFAVIKDVPKLEVYELCRHRNALAVDRGEPPPIPDHVLTKPPSAELRPDQRDDQSLPPYEELDEILAAYVEGDRTLADLVAAGYDPDVVSRIARLVDTAEYKRRQFPIGPRVTSKAFGRDRRLPITNGYRR
ncbi:MAG: NAD+ synthase [Acidimicrobiia bacterium]|nr:NAD+ synthase [Acidimicrobiia bacterium]